MDQLKLFAGSPIQISKYVTVRNCKLKEILEFGEEEYWSIVSYICSTSFDHRVFLDDFGIDYLDIDDWNMFLNFRYALDYEKTKIIIPDIDFSKLNLYKNTETEEVVLKYDADGDIIINESIYTLMVEAIRDCHNMSRNFKIPGNAGAREVYMREARDAIMFADRKPFKSNLVPLISSLCNSPYFKYNYNTVWDLNIYSFMDAVKRINKIRNADAFLQGMYSGMMDTSKMNKGELNKSLNWMGELK